MTCVAASSIPTPRSRITAGWTSRAYGPNAAPVPTAPDILPTTTRGDASRNRSLWRAGSGAQTATLSADVVGTAGFPWGRPRITVPRFLDADPPQTPHRVPPSAP